MYIGRRYDLDGKKVIDTSAVEKQEKLINFAYKNKANFNSIDSVSLELDIATYNLLLNLGLNPDIIIKTTINRSKPYNMTEEEFAIRQEELIKLAITNNADLNNISYIAHIPPLKIANLLLDNGLSSNKALDLFVRASTSANYGLTPEQKLVDLQKQLIDLSIKKGADIHTLEGSSGSFSLFSSSLPIEIYEKLLNLGLDANTVLKNALYTNDLEKRKELLTLALENKAKISDIYSVPSSISAEELDLLIKHGLDQTKALNLVMGTSSYDENSKQLKTKLIDLLLEKGAKLQDITYLSNDLAYGTYEYLLKKGLKADVLLGVAMNISAGEMHDKLIELAINNKANLNNLHSLSSLPSIEHLGYLLNMGLHPSNAMKLIINIDTSAYNSNLSKNASDNKLIELKHNLIDFLIGKGANFNSVEYLHNYDSEDLEFLLERGFDANKIVGMILESCQKAYKPSTEEYVFSKLSDAQKHILSISLKEGADLNSLEIFNRNSYLSDSEGTMVPYVIPHQIIETLIAEYSLNPRIAFEYAVKNNMQELAHLISLKNIDLNIKNDEEQLTFLEMAVIKGNMEMVDLIIAAGANQTIGLLSYVRAISSLKFSVSLRVVEKFQHQYDEKKAYNLLRAQGLSEVVSKDLIDYHNLLNDYLVSVTTKDASILNPLELRLLSDEGVNDNALEYQDAAFNNKYGYNPLHLAIIAGKFELASSMIRNGFDIYAKTHNNATPLGFLSRIDKMEFMGCGDSPVKKIIKAIYDALNTVDIELGNRETIADLLMSNPELSSKVIQLTNDELFYFFKTDADLFSHQKIQIKPMLQLVMVMVSGHQEHGPWQDM